MFELAKVRYFFDISKKIVSLCSQIGQYQLYRLMKITIIANGAFPTHAKVLRRIAESDFVVCCDGAFEKYLRWYKKCSYAPNQSVAVVGDGDSLNPLLIDEAKKLKLKVLVKKVSEQESNDLTKAVRFVAEMGERVEGLEVGITGATGLREDHTIGNISLLANYITSFPSIVFSMYSDYGTFYAMEGKSTFNCQKGQQISLFSLTPEIPVTVKGLKYPIKNRQLTQLWEATLNEAKDTKFEVIGGKMLVYLAAMDTVDHKFKQSK